MHTAFIEQTKQGKINMWILSTCDYCGQTCREIDLTDITEDASACPKCFEQYCDVMSHLDDQRWEAMLQHYDQLHKEGEDLKTVHYGDQS